MATITARTSARVEFWQEDGVWQEWTFLQGLIGQFAIRQFRAPDVSHAKFEVLYPPDANDAALNQIVNFPTGLDWTPANLACIKT